MKNYFILISIGVFILGSCKKPKTDKPYVPIVRCSDRTKNMDTINLYIKGDWKWVEEYRNSRYGGVQYFTPNSPGSYNLHLNLSGDTAKFYINNKADSFYRFKVQREYEITNYLLDSLPVLVFYSLYTSQRQSYVPIMICKNQLLMQHQYVSSVLGERLWVRK